MELTKELIEALLSQPTPPPREIHGFYTDGARERAREPEEWAATRTRAEAVGHVLRQWRWTSGEGDWTTCMRCDAHFDATETPDPQLLPCPIPLARQAFLWARELIGLRERIEALATAYDEAEELPVHAGRTLVTELRKLLTTKE